MKKIILKSLFLGAALLFTTVTSVFGQDRGPNFCNCEYKTIINTPIAPQGNPNLNIINASTIFGVGTGGQGGIQNNRCIAIDGILVFNGSPFAAISYNVTNVHFSFTPGSKVIINDNVRVKFTTCTLRGCPSWEGITVESGGEIEITTGSVISDTPRAITLQNESTIAIGAEFEDNQIGIFTEQDAVILGRGVFSAKFKDGAIGILNQGIMNDIGSTQGNFNVFGPNLPFGVRTVNGRSRISRSNFDFCTFGVHSLSSYTDVFNCNFLDCRNGVNAVASDLFVRNNQFNEGTAAVFATGTINGIIDISDNTITSVGGIECTNINTELFKIENNTISPIALSSSKGIELSSVNSSGGIVKGNILTFKDVRSYLAITATSCNGVEINENVITSDNSSVGIGIDVIGCNAISVKDNVSNSEVQGKGIGVVNSPNTILCNNATVGMSNGIQYEGFSPSVISGNLMSGNQIGLFYNTGAVSLDQIHTGNIWAGNSSSGFEAFHSDPLIADQSEYEVAVLPGQTVPSVGWFSVTSGDPMTCGGTGSKSGGEDDKDLDGKLKIVDGALYTSEEYVALQHSAERFLLNELEANPADVLLPEFQDFLTSNISTNLKQFNDVDDFWSDLGRISQKDKSLLEANDLMVESKYEALTLLDKANVAHLDLGENGDFSKPSQEKLDFLVQRAALVDDVNNLKDVNQSILAKYKKLAAGKMQEIKNTLYQIRPTTDYLGNEKFVRQLQIKFHESGVESYTDDEIEQLELVAKGCPNKDGMAVYLAKSLYAHLDAEIWEYEAKCNGSVEGVSHLKNDSTSGNVATLFPNPASDYVTLKYSDKGGKFFISYEVHDVSGKLILRGNLEDNHRNKLNVGSLENGLYFLKLIDESDAFETLKFNILK